MDVPKYLKDVDEYFNKLSDDEFYDLIEKAGAFNCTETGCPYDGHGCGKDTGNFYENCQKCKWLKDITK